MALLDWRLQGLEIQSLQQLDHSAVASVRSGQALNYAMIAQFAEEQCQHQAQPSKDMNYQRQAHRKLYLLQMESFHPKQIPNSSRVEHQMTLTIPAKQNFMAF